MLDIKATSLKLQEEEVAEVKWVSLDEFKKIFYSDAFCAHDKEYKNMIVKLLEERLK